MSLLPTPRRVPSNASLNSVGGTPQRRSHHDLQLLINELFEQRETIEQGEDGSRKCQCRELPHLVRAFQERRNLIILQDEEFGLLESFAQQHPEVYVSSEDLVGLLTAITPSNSDNNAEDPPESPTAKYANKTLPTPPLSSGDSDTENSSHETGRGRSHSNSSGSSQSSRGSNVLVAKGTLEGSGSAEPDELVFPRSYSMPEHLVSPPGTPMQTSSSFSSYQRKKTTSDPEKPDLKASASAPLGRTFQNMATPTNSSLTARQRSSPLEPAVPLEAGFVRRTRPAPPKTRRISADNSKFGLNSDGSSRSRQNSEEPSPRPSSPWDGVLSPNMPSLDSMMEEEHADTRPGNGRSRQSSSRSNNNGRDTSPLLSSSPNDRGFTSPLFQPRSPSLDPSPFHIIPRCPPLSQHDALGDISLDDAIQSIHTRPVSTASLGSDSSLSEMITVLQQELSRKVAQLDAQKIDSYSTILEKEALLEEVRAELGAKRREEKELRGKEKIYVSQIGTLEGQTAKYKEERDKLKIAYQNARKQYEEQCNESEKLRNTIRAKDEELRLADENVQNGNSDLTKITRERDFLQSTITRLEEELSEARLSISELEDQKSENLALKETIDRLRLDLDELRAQAKLSEFENGTSGGLQRSASGSDGLPGTISRNLGRELMRKLQDASMDDGTQGEEEKGQNPDESYEEEIVTTRRRLKRPVKKPPVDASNNVNNDINASPTLQTVSIDVVDVSIQCDMPSLFREDMSIQTEAEPEMSPLAKRNQLARELEVDLSAVEEYVRAKEERARLQAVVPDTAPPPYIQTNTPNWQRAIQPYAPSLFNLLPHDTRSSLNFLLNTTSGFLIYTLVVYLSGVPSGGALMPARHYHHVTSYDSFNNWKAYNMLDVHGANAASGGWKESLAFWLERIIWRGISISRRVPT